MICHCSRHPRFRYREQVEWAMVGGHEDVRHLKATVKVAAVAVVAVAAVVVIAGVAIVETTRGHAETDHHL